MSRWLGSPRFLSYQYRLYPLRAQLRVISHVLDELTCLWNYALAERRDALEKNKRRITYLDQQRNLTHWRNFGADGLGSIAVGVAQATLRWRSRIGCIVVAAATRPTGTSLPLATSSPEDWTRYAGTRRNSGAWTERLHCPERDGERIRGSANSRKDGRARREPSNLPRHPAVHKRELLPALGFHRVPRLGEELPSYELTIVASARVADPLVPVVPKL